MHKPHQLRVIEEQEQLSTKVKSLLAFTLGELFQTLTHTEKDLLTSQLQAMQKYESILLQRIALF